MESSDITQSDILERLVELYKLPASFKALTDDEKTKLCDSAKELSLSPTACKKLEKFEKNGNLTSYSYILKRLKGYYYVKLSELECNNGKASYVVAGNIAKELQGMGIEKSVHDKIAQDYNNCITYNINNEDIKAHHHDTIRDMLNNKKLLFDGSFNGDDKIFIKDNVEHEGVNMSFIVTQNSKKYFVKTCTSGKAIPGMSNSSYINPNELFLYKVMEYTGFGPKTEFLIEKYSSSRDSTAHGAYIMTEEVPNLLLDDGTFKLQDFNVSDRGAFSIDLSAASLLHDLLSLTDVFGRIGNYGFTLIDESTAKAYEDNEEQKTEAKQSSWIQFVDHLPGNNGHFSCITNKKDKLQDYSPRSQLQTICKSKDIDESVLQDMSWSYDSWAKYKLAKDTHTKLFEERKFENAIERAKNDIEKLIGDYGANFMERELPLVDNDGPTGKMAVIKAEEILNAYYEKIEKNIATYKNTHYYTEAQVTP